MRRSIALYVVLFAVTAAAQVAEDPGPSILSRGVAVEADTAGSRPTIKPFLSLSGVYDTGLTAVLVDATGKIPQTDDYGAEVGFGALGSKRWRRTALGIDYRGNLRKYSSASYYNGSDHILSLSVTRRLPGRLTLVLREAAGSYARSFGFASGYALFDPAIAGVPANELFDSRTTYLSSMANLRFQKSARLSFGVGGSGTIVRRRSGALVGSTGWSTNADVSYRLNRSITLGADYSFGHTEFTKAFGSSDTHTAGLNATFRLGRRWELGLRAGAARVALQNLVRIDFDPVVAAIVGQSSGIIVFRNTYFIPSSGANLSRAFRRSVFSIDYRNEPVAGNGVYTSSKSQSASVRYSFTGLQRLNFGLTAGYTTYVSLSQDLGRYKSYLAGVGFNYRLKDWLHLTSGYDVRKYDTSEAYRRLAHRVTIGLAFSPGEQPLPLR